MSIISHFTSENSSEFSSMKVDGPLFASCFSFFQGAMHLCGLRYKKTCSPLTDLGVSASVPMFSGIPRSFLENRGGV